MSENIQLVFSRPPAWLSPQEYSRWYEFHIGEILAVPGFTAARRFTLQPAVGSDPPTMYSHLSLYETEGEPEQVTQSLERESARGWMKLPEWFDEITFASFNGIALGDRPPLATPDHLYLVFSVPPAEIDFDDYSDWYATHLSENLTAAGFERGWRFRLEPGVVDPQAPCAATHAALYEVSADLADLRAALAEARDAGRVHFPDWFGEIGFASLDCLADGARVTATPTAAA